MVDDVVVESEALNPRAAGPANFEGRLQDALTAAWSLRFQRMETGDVKA